MQWLPDTVYGDDCNEGAGHLIQRKERFFQVPISSPARPEIYLFPDEERWADQLIKQSPSHHADHLPLCVLHPWGKTHSSVLSEAVWEKLVRDHRSHVRFWQVGIEGQIPIQGCERHLLLPRSYPHARKLFAAMSRADFFIGVDSGPMHVARAFDIPSLILTDYGVESAVIFSKDQGSERPLSGDGNRLFIYEANQHCNVIGRSAEEIMTRMRRFIQDEAEE
jgi:ADP-heptose:LPS heptosyltransferase